MEIQVIATVLKSLNGKAIPACLVGELALNYYNVPRVLHDIEICVRASDLVEAARLLSILPGFELAPRQRFDNYTAYQRNFPRFQYHCERATFVTLFSDTYLHLDPLLTTIVPRKAHKPGTQYSKELSGLIPPHEVPSLPFPKLQPLFAGVCQRYKEHQDDIAAIAAEQLIDGMDLDEDWCRKSIPQHRPQDLEFALQRLEGKKSRTADSFINTFTCFIADETEARIVHAIPGRDVSATSEKYIMGMSFRGESFSCGSSLPYAAALLCIPLVVYLRYRNP